MGKEKQLDEKEKWEILAPKKEGLNNRAIGKQINRDKNNTSRFLSNLDGYETKCDSKNNKNYHWLEPGHFSGTLTIKASQHLNSKEN